MPAPHIGGEKSAGQGDFRTQKGNGGVSDVQLWGQVGWARGGTMGWVAPCSDQAAAHATLAPDQNPPVQLVQLVQLVQPVQLV